jgi:5-formyltetrahydrofolate cyclo-ligase
MSTLGEKQALRARIIREREALPEAVRREQSVAITRRLLALTEWADAQALAAYASFRGEFDTSELIAAALAAGKRVVVPRVSATRDRLEFCFIVDPARDLAPGTWGIPEPRAGCERLADGGVLELVLLPGVAFTRGGHRLGYGRGYYDQFVAGLAHRPTLVAAAYSMQIVDTLPVEAHDRRVHVLVTERETIRINDASGTDS